MGMRGYPTSRYEYMLPMKRALGCNLGNGETVGTGTKDRTEFWTRFQGGRRRYLSIKYKDNGHVLSPILLRFFGSGEDLIPWFIPY